MKSCRIRVLSVLSVLTLALPVQACGPFFPVSYFPHSIDDDNTYDAARARYDYRVTPHLGTELAMIGAHYYPAWTGKAPKGNHVSTSEADEADFFSAGEAAGGSKRDIIEDWRRFVAFRDSVCRRLENGEEVELPTGIPAYAVEFYLYKLGHAQWLVFRKDEDPAPFGKLLALPEERRSYRTVWVHFVRIANAQTFSGKDVHVDALRKAVDAGFKDTAGLEAFTLRFLSRTCGNRYDPLVLTAYAGVEWKEWPGFAKRIFCRRRPLKAPGKEWIETMCTDQAGVEVAIAYGAGGHLPAGAVRPEKPALEADRQAWIAFSRGDLDLCRKLLAIAPERSLVRLFLEARLARLDGNYEQAGKFLHDWLVEYRRKGDRTGNVPTGYSISGDDYWLVKPGRDNENEFWDTINYSGMYGPSGYFREDLYGSSRGSALPESSEPTLSRIVSGELGAVMVATRDLEEALYAFLLARNWIDIAFVAERCMTADELMKFMRGNRIEPRDKDILRGLLMRRLMRCGRIKEASAWAPEELKPLCDEFCALSDIAHDESRDFDTRAVAFFNLSRLTLTRGMEIMGTELRPDVAIYGGDYSWDAVPVAEPAELPARMGGGTNDARWAGWKAPQDRVTERFHYRRKAIDYAKAAVEYAKSPDIRAWALMLGGVASLSLHDVKEADWFYKRSAEHPRTRIGNWFTLSPVYRWFREEYYNKERHMVPLRVPPRFTKKDFMELKMPAP